MTLIALLVVLSTGFQTPPDTAPALKHAKELLKEHYPPTRVYDKNIGGTTPACEASDVWRCMRGDWSCIDVACLDGDRLELLRRLQALAPEAGNSDWLLRQRVAVALKSGNVQGAAAIAGSCSGEDPWCLMLRGFTRHRLSPGDGVAQFDSAFALLGDSVRCAWTDPRPTAPLDLLDLAGKWRCPADEAQYRRFWWLADPLWSRPGNERYMEHLSRRVMSQMTQDVYALRGARFDPGGRSSLWEAIDGDDPWGIPVRQGFPNSILPLVKSLGGRGKAVTLPAVYVYGGYGFVPDSVRFLHPLSSTAEDWALEWRGAGCASMWTERARRLRRSDSRGWFGRVEDLETCGQERYTPAETWHALPEYQIAGFRRGARLLLASAALVPPEIGPVAQLDAALAVARPQDMSIRVAHATVDALRVSRTRLSVPDTDGRLASLEVIGPGNVARARFAMAPLPPLDEGFGLSDIALVNAGAEPDTAAIEESLLPFRKFTRDQPVGVYLEAYGLRPGEHVDVTLTLGEQGVGVFGKIGRFLHLSSGPQPVKVTWRGQASDVQGSTGPTPLFVTVDLKNVSSGDRRMVVEVKRSDGRVARAVRNIVVG